MTKNRSNKNQPKKQVAKNQVAKKQISRKHVSKKPAHAKNVSGKKTFSSKFTIAYLIVLAILVVAVEAGLYVFRDYLRTYERVLPNGTAARVFAECFEALDYGRLFELEKASLSEYETLDRYTAYLAPRTAEDGKMSYRNVAASEDDTKRYAVYRGDSRFGEFELTQSGEGRDRVWEASRAITVHDLGDADEIIVPEGYIVFVNGGWLDESYKTGVAADGLAGMQDHYAVAELLPDPVIETQGDDGYVIAMHYDSGIGAYTVARLLTADVLEGDTLYINGVAIGEDALIKEGILTDEVVRMKTAYRRYGVTANFGRPDIYAVTRTGKIESLHALGGLTYVQAIAYSDELEASFGELAKNAAMEYAKYVENDSSVAVLRIYFEQGTDTWQSIRLTDVSWNTKHNAYRFENVLCSAFFELGEDTFACRVTLDHYLIQSGEETLFPLDVTLFFRASGDRWLVYDMRSNA